MDTHRQSIASLKAQLGKVILGKPEAIESLVVALLSGSHILMEDVPGVGKTTLAKALAPSFRVNGVVPGPVLPPDDMPETELAAILERTLLKRLGDPRHVAQAVEFLLVCDYATGSMVEVTGGSQLWRGSVKAGARKTREET